MSILIEAKRIEARHALLESLDNSNRKSYIQWETVGTYLREAALSPQQIQGLFGEIEKTATAGGANRTGIGQAKDKVDQVIMKPWNDLKAKIYNSGPMEGFAGKYEEAAEKLKASAGGDEGAVMKVITKYRAFAEKHPIMQGFIYAALIAAAGVSGAGLGGAAALGLFKLTDQLLQGKDVRSALYSAGKTGTLAYGASTLGDMIKGGDAVQQATADIPASGDLTQGVDVVIQDFVPGEPLSTGEMNAILDSPTQDGIPQEVLDQYNSQLDAHVKSLPGGDIDLDAETTQDAQDGGIDDVAGTEKVEVLDSPVRGDVQTAESPEQLIQDGDKIDRRLSKGSVRTYTDVENSAPGRPAQYKITTDADGNYVKTYTRPLGSGTNVNDLSPAQLARRNAISQSGHSLRTNVLSEDQVAKLFVAVALGNHKLMEAPGLLQRAKAQIGKGVTAAAGKAKQIGTNITTKVTADKLMKAWTKAGKPTDSIQVAQFLTNFGVDGAVLQQSYQTAGMKMPDIKKIATDDPVMALAQRINQDPAIKKQVIAYLQQAT